MSAFWSGHVGAAAGCCLKVLLSEWCVRLRCCLRVLLSVRFGAGWRCRSGGCCVSGHAGAVAACRCSVLPEGVCALEWEWCALELACWPLQGAASGWLQGVAISWDVGAAAVLSECCVCFGAGVLVSCRVPLQRAVCILLMLLQGAAVRSLGPAGDNVYAASVWLPTINIFCYLGSMA